MSSLLQVSPEQIKIEIDTPRRAVDLIRDLLWAEAGRQNVNPFKISFSDKIYTADGGVDGTTINIHPKREGLLFGGTTYYQIKWGEGFDPRKKANLEKELLEKNKTLKPKLNELAKKKGTYVLIWFGGSFTGNDHEKCCQQIKDIFKQKSYSEVKVFVLDCEKIAQACGQSLIIQSEYFRSLNDYFLPIESWKNRFTSKKDHPKQREQDIILYQEDIDTIQNAVLTSPYNPVQILPGTDGRDHRYFRFLVYESLKRDGISQKTICVDADHFRPPLTTSLEVNSDLNHIVVIDDCQETHHKKILDVFSQRLDRLGCIIISTDNALIDDKSFGIIGRKGLKDSAFLNEIRSKVPSDQVVITGVAFDAEIPEQEIIELPVAIQNVYSKISAEAGYETLNLAKRVLRFVALFSRIGSEINVTAELRFLAKKIGFVEEYDWLTFTEIVHFLRKYALIEGQYFIKISDANYRRFLVQEWWSIYGASVSFESFLTEIYVFSEDLAQRLVDSISYISATASGKRIAQSLLGESGIFSNGALLKYPFGASLFSNLAVAAPAVAVQSLKKTIGVWGYEELSKFTTGRREVIWALERIAIWRSLFPDAARLLLALGAAENENWANNASGVFTEMFSLGYGKVASTQAPPEERFPILIEALNSTSKAKRLCALRAFDHALEVEYITRAAGPENQGTRKEPQLWTPQTYGELFNAYRAAWKMLYEKLENMNDDEKSHAMDILLKHSKGLLRIADLADIVLESIENLTGKPYADKNRIFRDVSRILHYHKAELQPKVRERLERIKEKLIGDDFSSMVRLYVRQRTFDEAIVEQDDRKTPQPTKLDELAQQAIENRQLLENELPWLVTKEAENSYKFGYALGNRDISFSLLPSLLNAQRNAERIGTIDFLSGYYRSMFEINSEEWEKQLDCLAKDNKLCTWIPELTYRSGVTDRAILRIINLSKKYKFNFIHLQSFGVGVQTREVSEETFIKWILFLLTFRERRIISIALSNYFYFYTDKDSQRAIPEQLTLKLLTHHALFRKSESPLIDQMEDHYWTELGIKFSRVYPKSTPNLLRKILAHFGDNDSIVGGFFSYTHKVLNEISKNNPQAAWKVVIQFLGPPIDDRAYRISQWLRGGEFSMTGAFGALIFFPLEYIWDWVDEDVEKRASYVAYFAPNTHFSADDKIRFWRQVLIRYGDRDDVREELRGNFSAESFSGPASLHYETKKQKLLELKKNEQNENVKTWINEYVAELDARIVQSNYEEERRVY